MATPARVGRASRQLVEHRGAAPLAGGRTSGRRGRASAQPAQGGVELGGPRPSATCGGDGVDSDADGPGGRRSRRHRAALQHPAQRAAQDLLDVGRRHRHASPGSQRRGRRRAGQAPPVGGIRARHPAAASRASWPRRPRRGPGGAHRRGSGPGRPGAARPPARPGRRARPVGGRLVAPCGTGSSSSRNRRRLLVLVHSTAVTSQRPPGPGAGDVEQPPLLVEQRGDAGTDRLGAGSAPPATRRPAARSRAGCRAAAGRARRPPARRRRDDVPLQALGGVRGEQRPPRRRGAAGAPGCRRRAAARGGRGRPRVRARAAGR